MFLGDAVRPVPDGPYPTQVAGAAGAVPTGTTLLLLTHSYPYLVEREQTFIEPQLPSLRRAFERVVVVPSQLGGGRAIPPDGIEVDESLATTLGSRWVAMLLVTHALASRLFWGELAGRPSIAISPRAVKRLLVAAGQAELTRSWFRGWVRRAEVRPDRCVAYTFWCDGLTAGLVLAKEEQPGLVVVARVNGFDLFLERHRPPYLPLRRATLERLDRLYAVSDCGKRYTVERYPWFEPRCEVSRLGVHDPGGTSPAPTGRRRVIASCSRIHGVKRVELILRGVARAARRRPDLRFEWHHFGDGEEADEVERSAQVDLPDNARAIFHGNRTTAEIIAFYLEEPVAAFINASSSEGGSPVAIMEAASCGIPIIATAVGGNPEIVSERNGALVSADPTPDEIADALIGLVEDPPAAAARRLGSRRVWEERFVARVNYADFADRLARLRGTPPSDRPGQPGSSGTGS